MKIEIYDTTLRDGAQGAGVCFSLADRAKIIRSLDALGVSYIEIGNFDTPDSVAGLLRELDGWKPASARLAAFGSTRRPNTSADEDPGLRAMAHSALPVCTVFGKCSAYQAETVLMTTQDENIAMISDSVRYLRSAGKEVHFDAEHFFDGYSDNPTYALRVLDAAYQAGADRIVLCDTNGGMLPDVIGMTVEAVRKHLPDAVLGIHCHNDLGMAVACSVSGVLAGAAQLQGTFTGIGERCGNADLSTLIPLLQLKLGYQCITPEQLRNLTPATRALCEIANLSFNEHAPFVGGYAFTHKAGMHIDGVRKDPRSFEHTIPENVGNVRNLLVSDQAGRAALASHMQLIDPTLQKDAPEVAAALDKVREYEDKGFQFEGAEASLLLILLESLGKNRRHFELTTFKVLVSEPYQNDQQQQCSALIKVAVGESEEITAAEGNGPVNALDLALRRALTGFYPCLGDVRLSDYKVRVFESDNATASRVRVFIESTDGIHVWRTTGVSADIIDASWQALRDSVEYKLSIEEHLLGSEEVRS